MQHKLEEMMRVALGAASEVRLGDLPVAAVVFDHLGSPIATKTNEVECRADVTAHAEIIALRSIPLAVLKQGALQMTMVVTLEPCPMCAWAIRASGLGRLVFGASNPLYGAAGSVFDLLRDVSSGRFVEVIGGVLEAECQELVAEAFKNIRNNRKW